ncbi:hypothetical protein CN318_12445 [Bacillus cereus]|nr:hypothetical protein CN318_12445 [Bacillus cereus]
MVKNPVTYRRNNELEINKSGNNWKYSGASDTRKDIRDYLIKEFNNTCCYCQINIPRGNTKPEIDHVVHKKIYKQFTYHPKNLVLACPNCNHLKGMKETLIRLRRVSYCSLKNYPCESRDFLIIHPYFDDYDKHIEIEASIFYQPKEDSDKGKETIRICHLYRLQLAEQRAKELRERIGDHKKEFSVAYSTGTDEEIRELTQKKLKEDWDIPNAVISITSELSIVGVAETIHKNKGTYILNKENIELLKEQYKMKGVFIDYLNVMSKIKKKSHIKEAFTMYLKRKGLEQFTFNYDLLFSKDAYDAIKNGMKNKQIIDDGRKLTGIKKLIKQIDTPSLSEKKFCKLMNFTNKASLLFRLVRVSIELLENREVKRACEEIKRNPELLNTIEKDLSTLGKWTSSNPEFNALTKLRYIIEIESFNVKDLENIKKALANYLKNC